jgi:hypothetical protein
MATDTIREEAAQVPTLTKKETVASIIDPEAWANEIESRKGNCNPQHIERVKISLRKAEVIEAVYAN